MLDTRFSHLYFCQRLYTLQRGLPAIAGLLVSVSLLHRRLVLLSILILKVFKESKYLNDK